MKSKSLMTGIALAVAFCVAACGTKEEAQQFEILVKGCDDCSPEGPQCQRKEIQGEWMLCRETSGTQVTVASDAPTTTTVATGSGTTTTTTNPTPTCATPGYACPSGQTCQWTGTTNACVTLAPDRQPCGTPGTGYSGTCPYGQLCELSGSTYACVPSPFGRPSLTCSRSGENVTLVFTNVSSSASSQAFHRFGDSTPRITKSVIYILPAGGSRVGNQSDYGWGGSVEAYNASAQIVNGSATLTLHALPQDQFVFSGCDRDPRPSNHGCSEVSWPALPAFDISSTCIVTGTNLRVQ